MPDIIGQENFGTINDNGKHAPTIRRDAPYRPRSSFAILEFTNIEGIIIDQPSAPGLRRRQDADFGLDEPSAPLVICLIFGGRPSAVPRFVNSVIIDAFY